MEEDQFWFQYFNCWYYSVLAFALVDLLPRAQRQIMFIIIVYVLNTIGYSTIIGIFIDTLQLLQEKEQRRQDIIDDADVVMRRY